MSSFSKFDKFSLVEGTKYIIDEDLYWDIGIKNSGWKLLLPKGFQFDMSVPSYLHWALDPHDRKILMAAAVHDKLLIDGHDAAFASSEFRRACIARGVGNDFAWALFLVTFFWTFKYKNKTTPYEK